ncbi:MAG: Asp-tRNA(Asn)/Glu-tRNA(Gln) amidotransferase subunit GatC [Planctomycetota bacterium]|nr:Asp-tRNA(Asn)/Glu-tRNA(Gln) amidotransferase subunit GatC [Planctomycetota bacterium]
MDIDETLVRHVARLARLELTDGEVADMVPQLSRIFAHVDQVQDLDVGDADPATQAPVGLETLRGDEPGPVLGLRDVLSNAPDHDGAFLVVPRFFDDASDEG